MKRRLFFRVILAVGCVLAAAGAAPAALGARDAASARLGADPPHLYLPLIGRGSSACPVASDATYAAAPVLDAPSGRPAALHPDLNLAVRGFVPARGSLSLVDYDGPTDPDAPQIPGMFDDGRVPAFVSGYRVYHWDWWCGFDGCRGEPITWPGITLLSVATTPGERIAIPSRRAEVYAGGYIALVLYADEQRITLKYTREDSVVTGYTVHVEGVCVDPALLRLYRSLDAAGRSSLPALRNGETWGTAAHAEIGIAMRDRGTFLDPRSRKDWWSGR